MEWGTFLTVIFALYLVWYGFNFLIDIMATGKPGIQTEQAVQYNVHDFLKEEELAQEVKLSEYDKPVAVINPNVENPTPEAPNSGGITQHITAPVSTPAPTTKAQEYPMSDPLDDWASAIDQEEEIINIPVQGQPIPVMDFIQSFKDDAKSKAAQIFS